MAANRKDWRHVDCYINQPKPSSPNSTDVAATRAYIGPAVDAAADTPSVSRPILPQRERPDDPTKVRGRMSADSEKWIDKMRRKVPRWQIVGGVIVAAIMWWLV